MSMPSDYRIGKYDKPVTYAVKHKDIDTRMASRSGGLFTAISDFALQHGGVVYGCVLDDEFSAIHVRAETVEQRNRMRGSKYIQSNIQNTYTDVKKDLDEGRIVLFSGTSCQITGLKAFLQREHNRLICVDIVCHGVPSPMVWHDYLYWQENKNRCEIEDVDFRNKRDYGWRDHIESLFLKNGKQIDSKLFTTLFYGHNILRPCCYKCPYKDIIHPGDITIADYWGVEKALSGFDDNKGVSLLLINDDKGKIVFEAVQDELVFEKTRIEDSMQPPLRESYKEPERRSVFWSDYMKLSFEKVL